MKLLCKIFSRAASLQEYPGTQAHIGKKDSQMLHGETFLVQNAQNGWAFGSSELDGYTGWIEESHLTLLKDKPTHAISCLMTNLYHAPDFKTPPVDTLSFMARVTIDATIQKDGFVMLRDNCLWVPENHLTAIDDLAANPADIIDTALMFSDCPYLYGGRNASGIDCSGLVQLALQRNGLFCPRDCNQQDNVIGVAVSPAALQGGDVVYFPGHVGIMKDDVNIINATARHMKVIVERLDDLIAVYGQPTAVRRLIPAPSP